MMVLSATAKQALERAQTAYKATQEAENARALNRAETRFYASTEALFHVLNTDQSSH